MNGWNAKPKRRNKSDEGIVNETTVTPVSEVHSDPVLNTSVTGRLASLIPPHPDPFPEGEGEAFDAGLMG